MPAAKKSPRTMTANHKAALVVGRDEGRKVRAYLEVHESAEPRSGPKRSAESIEKRLGAVQSSISGASGIRRLRLAQQQIDLRAELEAAGETIDLSNLEADFITVARAYGERKGISYAAWRTVGVAPSVLRAAGIGPR